MKLLTAFALCCAATSSVECSTITTTISSRSSNNVSPTVGHSSPASAASAHYSRMLKEARCDKPAPRVVHVENVYKNAQKKFVPRCTIIHTCSETTGCCLQETERCSPRTQETVSLSFFVVELTEKGVQKKGVEVLDFTNHTSCHCQQVNEKGTLFKGPSSATMSAHSSPFPSSYSPSRQPSSLKSFEASRISSHAELIEEDFANLLPVSSHAAGGAMSLVAARPLRAGPACSRSLLALTLLALLINHWPLLTS